MTQHIHYQATLVCEGILAGQLKLASCFFLKKDLAYAGSAQFI